jgi:23S rRNA pseudouridine955/2504/2580 synthase
MIAPVKVSATEDGVRLRRWMARHYPDSNMILVRRLCRSGEIRINSKRCGENDVQKAGDLIRIPPSLSPKSETQGQKSNGFGLPTSDIGLFSLSDLEKLRKCIIHDDGDVVVFNKPAGLAAQGGSGVKKPLDKMAAALFPNDTALLVHRLDKETSGVIVMAKNQMAAQKLARDFQSKGIHKEYIAVLSGAVRPRRGIIDDPIGGKSAVTKYEVIGELPGMLSVVRFTPHTGRKHQLRRHSSAVLNAPIIGDDLYGGGRIDAKLRALLSPNRLHLLASRLTFRHPRSGKTLTINAPVPEWMKPAIDLCEAKI